MAVLQTNAEQIADRATKLASFPINLGDIKRTVTQILSLFGRNLMFHEYTTHDVTHIDDMLVTTDWLIPADTRAVMSSADWLMLVLAIYFHDMGLVVTEEEFKRRNESGYLSFCSEVLFSGPSGPEYRDKVFELPDSDRERFLYQEFVRANHGRRVRAWIEGKAAAELGTATAQIAEVDRLLSPLDSDFRRDLALVCESHNLDDVDNTEKYKISQPYGNSEEETVNIQYCAVLLRTVDLLQITRRRAPSVMYRLIDPGDPVSQFEWAKQNAVRRVRAKPATDREGNASADLQSDTIEAFATFQDDNGFFGLTSYLRYAADQLAASYDILQRSKRLTPKKYQFPWRYVDDANVGVEGFLKKPFGFEIDQEKILDLLTGHTLYNDSAIVVRELAQNAIDAVRLQLQLDNASDNVGRVEIKWSSARAELEVIDNGTGMSQDIIERHLLKVGSSRYQDPKFKEAFPKFSPISRFGIGVLSCFMVADSVEIVTVSPDEDQARQISLRSVHGKYLIRLLDKAGDPRARRLGLHGTSLKLKFRSSAKRLDVTDTLRKWVLFPRCKVTVCIDDEPEIAIGFGSPKDAIEQYLRSTPVLAHRSAVKVEERAVDGLVVAYALEYNAHFRDWNFVRGPERRAYDDESHGHVLIGTCVEGIAVEFSSPGYKGWPIVAIANATGQTAPKTNVARSSLEATGEKEAVSRKVYDILFSRVAEEAERLRTEEKYSLTWAVDQVPYIMLPLMGGRLSDVEHKTEHRAALAKVPMFLVETDTGRSARTLAELIEVRQFWTVESELMRSVEHFIREARAEVTARQLLAVSQSSARALPNGPIVANSSRSEISRALAHSDFGVTHIDGIVAERRVDILWECAASPWLSEYELVASASDAGILNESGQLRLLRSGGGEVCFPLSGVTSEGLDDYLAVRAYGRLYVLPNTPVCDLIQEIYAGAQSLERVAATCLILGSLEYLHIWRNDDQSELAAALEKYWDDAVAGARLGTLLGRREFIAAAMRAGQRLRIFDPLAWASREAQT